jgi:peptidyl-prolyl cis-trans isomerase C
MKRQIGPRGHAFACALPTAALIVLIAISGCGKKDASSEAEGPVAAKVNGHAIHENEVARELGQMSQMMQQQGGQMPTDPAGMQQMRQNAVNNLVDKQLLKEQVEKEGLAPNDAEVKAEIDKVKAQYPDEAAFLQRLQALGLSEDDLREEISFNMAMQRLAVKHQDAAPDASPEEAQKYYDENRQQFLEPEGVRASHILIRSAATDPDTAKSAARARAEAALADVKGGRDFATVAKEKSEDPGSAPNGGDVQFFARGRMVPEFEQAAFALQVGEISPIVQTQFGYHIIKVTDKRAAREVPFAEVQDKVVQMLGQTKNERVVRALIQEARKTAKIEITEAGAAG